MLECSTLFPDNFFYVRITYGMLKKKPCGNRMELELELEMVYRIVWCIYWSLTWVAG